MTLGEWLYQKRVNNGETLRETAKEIGISAVYLLEIEKGEKIPSGAVLKKLSQYYHVSYFKLADAANCTAGLDRESPEALARIIEGLHHGQRAKVYEFIKLLGA